MEYSNDIGLIIQEHNFQTAKHSLKSLTDKSRESVQISRVETDGGFLWLGDHRVTGAELNTITSQIKDQFIQLNQFNSGVVQELTQVYNAFEALDKDYIAGILIAVRSADDASKKAIKNVEAIEKIIAALNRFNEKLQSLKHLMDVDKLWLDNAAHEDAIQGHKERINHMETAQTEQEAAIAALYAAMNELTESLEKSLSDHLAWQDQRLSAIEKDQNEKLDAMEMVQRERQREIMQTQSNAFAAIRQEQNEALEQIVKQQEELASIRQSLQKERNLVRQTKGELERKLTTAYLVAAGSFLVTAVHLILNVMGIL